MSIVSSIFTHLIKLDEDEEVGEHGAEKSHHILTPHREETHGRQPAFAPIAFRCPHRMDAYKTASVFILFGIGFLSLTTVLYLQLPKVTFTFQDYCNSVQSHLNLTQSSQKKSFPFVK